MGSEPLVGLVIAGNFAVLHFACLPAKAIRVDQSEQGFPVEESAAVRLTGLARVH